MNAESDARGEAAGTATSAPATGDVTGEVAPGVTEGVVKEKRALGSRAPGFVKASRALHLSWQVGVFVVGLAVVVGASSCCPCPGPAGW